MLLSIPAANIMVNLFCGAHLFVKQKISSEMKNLAAFLLRLKGLINSVLLRPVGDILFEQGLRNWLRLNTKCCGKFEK